MLTITIISFVFSTIALLMSANENKGEYLVPEFKKYITKNDFVNLMKSLNRNIVFYGESVSPGAYVIDYSKEPAPKSIVEEALRLNIKDAENFKMLIDHLNLKIEEGKRIVKK